MNNMVVGVIGCGVMGSGLAQLLCEAEAVRQVVWVARSQTSLNAARHSISRRWDGFVAKGKISPLLADKYKEKLVCSVETASFIHCQLVIESIAERFQEKCDVLAGLSSLLPEECVLASNTSSFSITDLSVSVKHPGRFVGAHFFNPAPVMKLVEISLGASSSLVTASFVSQFAKALGKNPVTVADKSGFVVNRLLIPFINDAANLVAEGVATVSDVDSCMVDGAAHPVGPLRLADLIGIDVCIQILGELHRQFGGSRFVPSPLIIQLKQAGKLGRKTGSGFYEYT